MASEIITRDGNHVTVGAGVDASTLDVTMLRTDASTNRLLIDIVATDAGTATSGQIASRDSNHRTVALVTDENGVIYQLPCTDDGYLLVNLE